MEPGLSVDRRGFVALAGAGLTLGCAAADASAAADTAAIPAGAPAGLVQPFLRLAPDGRVTVIVKHLEMGQGIATGLATILADALDCDWAQVRTEPAPVDPPVYRNLLFGFQATGGSTSIANSWAQLRAAGATARAMLLQAAAARWQVPLPELATARGRVLHAASGRSAGYGELAAEAAVLPVPPGIEPPAPGRHVGRVQQRVEARDLVRGAQRYGIDVQRPGQRIALIQRPPRFGATVRAVDEHEARAKPGVRGVHVVPQGVAVVADTAWQAMQARRALRIEWDDSKAESRSSAELRAEFRRLADAGEPGVDALVRGDVRAALAGAARVVEAEFEQPYLAHQAMEPLAATAQMIDGRCHVWAASQNPQADHAAVMRILGLKAEQVLIHGLPAGGSFGRRATFDADWISATVQVLKAHGEATGTAVPVQLLWTRDDEFAAGYFRPMNLHRLRVGLAADGRIVGCEQTIVAQSFLFGAPKPGVALRPDPTVTDGHFAGRYDVLAARLRWVNPTVGVPVQMYRSLSHNHTTVSKEVLMDDLARAAGRDALAYRLAHLQGHARQAAVLRAAAERAGWGRSLPPGRALGLAVQEAHRSYVAQVAQVRLEAGRPVVERVVCAVDCGLVINPDLVRAQMESGIAFGLNVALHGDVTLDSGRVQQHNFDDAPVLRLHEMPAVEVILADSREAPTGVGEPGSVPVIAAVANAVTTLTGRPVRRLPLRLG